MFHSSKKWVTKHLPEIGKEVFGLVEYDTESEEDFPFIEQLVLEKDDNLFRWRLVNYDPEFQEEYLQQYHTVVMWRYI